MMRLGIAVGTGRIVAAEVRNTVRGTQLGRVFERSLDTPPGDGGWPEVTTAVNELLAELRATPRELAVALLPPLARAKVLWLPRLGRRDLRALVTRSAGRYFVGAGHNTVADAVPIGGRGRPGLCRTLAACARTDIVDAVAAAVAESGIPCAVITAAAPACTAGIGMLAPETRQGRCVVVLDGDDWRAGVALSRGQPVLLEPWDWAPENRLNELAAQLASAAFNAKVPVIRSSAVGNSMPVDSAALVAWGAAMTGSNVPLLVPDDLREAEERRAVWAGIRLAAGALAAVVLGAGLYLVGLHRELAAVTAARRELATDVRQVLEARRLVRGLSDRLSAVGALDARGRWTPRVVALARALPDSTYLTSLVTDSGAIRVQGVAPSAAAAVRALQASERLASVRLLTTVRAEGGDSAERFDLVLAAAGAEAAANEGARAAPRERFR